MSYWDDEDYFEPSEFDEKIEELKEELRNSVRQEIKDEVERLRKENEERVILKITFQLLRQILKARNLNMKWLCKMRNLTQEEQG